MKNKFICGFLAAGMALGIFSACLPVANADNNIITIKTRKDFTEFAKNCTLDSFSKGKTVNLTNDIDFSGRKFVPVPTFDGTFNGNGHTLYGISHKEKGSYKGVFRYVEQDGKISDLNIRGDFTISGSKSFVGGIVGENAGTLENCSFYGTVTGENVIGGIIGHNTDSGQVISCVTSGNITGENSTGGIVGKNSGFVRNCTNNSSVNTVYEEKKTDIANLDTDTAAILENYKLSEEENSEESVLGHTDTGGIAGVTSGIIQGCVNNGAVGYNHIGYNVGGIAGRQSGYILGCSNSGIIKSRKDVGGIVGQAEPYILLHASESTLSELKSELSNLNTMVNKFISDTDNWGNSTKTHLDGISQYAKNAEENAESLINQGTDFADDNLAEINAQAAILSNTIDKLVPVFDSLEDGGEDFANSIDLLAAALDEFNISSPDLSNETDEISDALSELASGGRKLKKSITKAKRAINDLGNVISFNNSSSVNKALSDLSTAIADIAAANENIAESLGKIETIISEKPETFEELGLNTEKIIGELKIVRENAANISAALNNIKSAADTLISNAVFDFSQFKSFVDNINYSVTYLIEGLGYISNGLSSLGQSLSDFSDKFETYIDDISDEFSNAKENITDSLDSLSYAISDITDSISDIKNIVSDLSNEDTLEFVRLGDDFKSASEGLFNSLSGISTEIDDLKNTISAETDKITIDLTSISNQFNLVMNLLIGEVEELKNGVSSVSDIFVDVSDEDISSARQGKIADCQNFAKIEADRNCGGIVGNMAIEYSKDPEDDIQKPTTLNFTYRTKAIVQTCINDGEVICKKDCIGGIVGKSEIGTVFECENYADIESTNGNYIGGIVGKSDANVRKSYAKSTVCGKRYIGGVVGKGAVITSCCSISVAEGDENVGAVCGDAPKDNLHNNYYVDSGIGGLDGISYSEKCEAVSFDTLRNVNGIPSRFISFSITFIADGKTIESLDVKYGEETKRIKTPNIPKKDGYFGKWKKIDAETVTENLTVECIYQPYITLIASEEKRNKLPLALAEGEFTDDAKLAVKDSTQAPPVDVSDNVKVYDILLSGSDIQEDETVKIRLLNENKNKVTLWQFSNGEWEKIKTSSKGKYAIAELSGTENTVCICYEGKTFGFVWIITIISLISAIAVAITTIKKRKKNSKNAIYSASISPKIQ